MRLVYLSFYAVCIVHLLTGCGAMIKGTADTTGSPLGLPEKGTTVTVQMYPSDPTAQKIALMLAYKLAEYGWKLSSTSPELIADFRYGVTDAGSTSVATTIPGRSTATFIGDTAYIKSSPSTTYVNSTQTYAKQLSVTIRRASDNAVVWSGSVSEAGSCNRFVVTAPQIITLLFDGFPLDQTNKTKVLSSNSDQVRVLQKLFPPDTNWTSC